MYVITGVEFIFFDKSLNFVCKNLELKNESIILISSISKSYIKKTCFRKYHTLFYQKEAILLY